MIVAYNSMIVVFLATLSVGSYVLASLDEYGEFSQDRDGFIKLCFTASLATQKVSQYATEEVTKELTSDRQELWSLIMGKYGKFSGTNGCTNECANRLVPESHLSVDFGGRKFAEDQCFEWAKYQRLCGIFKDVKSGEEQHGAVKNWVCESEKKLKFDPKDRQLLCKERIQRAGWTEGSKVFHRVAEWSGERLRKEKLALSTRLAQVTEAKEKHDRRIREKAFSEIKDSVEELFSAYKRCFDYEEEQKIAEAEENKSKNGMFGRIARHFGKKSN